MGIGHHGHMFEDKGEIGEIFGLGKGPGFNIVKPELDRLFFGGYYLLHGN